MGYSPRGHKESDTTEQLDSLTQDMTIGRPRGAGEQLVGDVSALPLCEPAEAGRNSTLTIADNESEQDAVGLLGHGGISWGGVPAAPEGRCCCSVGPQRIISVLLLFPHSVVSDSL